MLLTSRIQASLSHFSSPNPHSTNSLGLCWPALLSVDGEKFLVEFSEAEDAVQSNRVQVECRDLSRGQRSVGLEGMIAPLQCWGDYILGRNMNIMHSLFVYPVFHVQNMYFISFSDFLLSSKKYSSSEINLGKGKPCTGRGSGTSGLRGAPSACKVEETSQYLPTFLMWIWTHNLWGYLLWPI